MGAQVMQITKSSNAISGSGGAVLSRSASLIAEDLVRMEAHLDFEGPDIICVYPR